MEDVYFVKFYSEGRFYSVYYDDAYVISYIMNYKLIHVSDTCVKTGFPAELLDEVIYFLRKNHISYWVEGMPDLSRSFGKENRYSQFVKRNLDVASVLYPFPKIYSGSFSILFDEDEGEEFYVIGDNISSEAEIVKKVFDHEVGDIVSLDSGITFQILSKDMKE